ncbi:MAG: hypothetical protein ACPG8W_11025 [Candidatus Promineifilaceae bacterium]
MSNNSILRKLLTGSLTLVALFALAGSALFFTDSASADQGGVTTSIMQRARRGGERGGGFLDREARTQIVADTIGVDVAELEAARENGESWKDVAEANGVDPETVKAAVQAAEIAAINEAVANGDITQEEADEIIARKELKVLARQIIDKEALKQVKADALGITAEELDQAKEDGVRLNELAEENGTTVEAIKAAVNAAKEAMVQDAVDNGTITEEQATQILEGGKGRRGGGNRGGGRGGNGPAPAQADA